MTLINQIMLMSKKLSEKIWWRNLAFAGAIISMLPVNLLAQNADTEDDELEELEAFTMVGSRISRVDATPISPVLQLSSDDIENTGFATIGDALRALPFSNGQSLSPTDSGTSFSPGISTMNLRGVGNNNTLILVNGRRSAPYAAPGYNGFQTMFDINSIPNAAIEAINIEKDGASALYGSDAVAGVVDFRLRTDYEGVSTSLKIGNFIDTDGFYRSGSFVYGTSTAKDSIIVALSYERQESVYARDLDYTADADNSKKDISDPKWSYGDEELAEAEGWTHDDLISIFGDAIADGWFDQRSSYQYPGTMYYSGVDGVHDEGYYQASGMTSNPGWDNALSGNSNHPYNYQETSNLYPDYKRYSLYTHIKHDVNEKLYVFAEVSYSNNDTHTASAPATASLADEHGLVSDTSMYIPVYNPYNYMGEDISQGKRRMIEAGNRDNYITSEAPRFLAGVGGQLSGDWSWEVGAMHSSNKVTNKAYVVADNKLQAALMGLTKKGSGYEYDSSTPLADRVYFNWSGYNDDQAMVDYLRDVNITSAEYILESIDFNLSGSVFELPAGTVGVSFGGEYREESLENNRTDLNAYGMIVGGSEGTSSYGSRDVTSLYAEAVIPATTWMEFQLASRWESYSDEGYGAEIRPKIGVKITPLDWFAIRASFGQSFKAPDLAYLYTDKQVSFTSQKYKDPVAGGDPNQIKILTTGNPDLDPETTDSYFLGFVFEPKGFFEGLTVSLDYVRLESEDLLGQYSSVYEYSEFLQMAAEGDSRFVDKVVRSSTGELLYIIDDYLNMNSSKYTAYDLNVTYGYETEKLGTFSVDFYASYLDSYTIDGDEQAGGHTMPEWKGNLSLGWNKGDWKANVSIDYIGGRDDVYYWSYDMLDDFGLDTTAYLTYDIDSQIVVSPQVSYSGLWNSTFTLGVYNVFNDAPPVDASSSSGFTSGVNYSKPFYWYLSWKKEF